MSVAMLHRLILGLTFMHSLALAAGRCEDLFTESVASDNSSRQYVMDNHQQNSFVTGRGLTEYQTVFSRVGYPTLNFRQTLQRLEMNPEAHWVDVGGGQGYATEQAITSSNKMKATVISVETLAQPIYDPKTQELRRGVIAGQFVEDITSIPPFDIWTDVYGAAAYSDRPDAVLRKMVSSAKPYAQGFVHLGDRNNNFGKNNLVVTSEGRVISYSDWLQKIPGLKVDIVKVRNFLPDTYILNEEISRTAKIKIVAPAARVAIPNLEKISYMKGDPRQDYIVPRMIFREKSTQSVEPEAPNHQFVKSSVETIFHGFRSGALTNSVLRELKRLNNQTWVHFGSQRFSWSDLESTASVKNDQFFGFSTAWILRGFRALKKNNVLPQIERVDDLPSNQSVKLITDLSGRLVSEKHVDELLQRYINALRDDGVILLNLGRAETGLAQIKVIQKDGTVLSFIEWLRSIPGLVVKNESSPKTVYVEKKELIFKSNIPPVDIETFPSQMVQIREVHRTTTLEIRIQNRRQIRIPKLTYLGKSFATEEGFEIPLFSENVD